jgi:hypothetical protein
VRRQFLAQDLVVEIGVEIGQNGAARFFSTPRKLSYSRRLQGMITSHFAMLRLMAIEDAAMLTNASLGSSLRELVHWFGVGHPPGEMIYWISQAVLAIVALIAARIAYRQVKAFGALELVKFMQQEHNRKARTHVRRILATKPLDQWTAHDKFEASTVCSSFDLMGFLLRQRLAPQKKYIRLYAVTVQRMHGYLLEFLAQERQITENGPGHWHHFTWLEQQAKKICPLPGTEPSTKLSQAPLEETKA